MDILGLADANKYPGANGGEKIQAAMDAAGIKKKTIWVGSNGPDEDSVWKITNTLKIPANTTLILSGAKLVLGDQVNDNIIRNANAGSLDGARDSNIHIIGLGQAEIDGNGSWQTRQSEVHWNFGIHFHKADNCSVQGITIGPTNAWGTSFEDVNNLIVDRIRFNQDGRTTNQDGVHVGGPGSRISISNILGTIGDDAIAIVSGADDPRGSCFGRGGLLTGVVVNNVSVDNIRDGAVLRTVASRGKPLDGVYASNLAIRNSNQVLKIGWSRFGLKESEGYVEGSIFPLPEEHQNICVDGVWGSTDDTFCMIESDVKNLTIRGVRGVCGNAAFSNCRSGYSFSLENTLLEDWKLDGSKRAVEFAGQSACKGLTLRDCRFTAKDTPGSTALYFSGEGMPLSAEGVSVENVTFESYKTGLYVDGSVTMPDSVCLREVHFINSEKELELHAGAVKVNGLGLDSESGAPADSGRWSVGDVVCFSPGGDLRDRSLFLSLPGGKWVRLGPDADQNPGQHRP
jgi:hypothetical protein